MKIILLIFYILIVLFKTGNVLSNENIFSVDNIEISNENSKKKEEILDIAFKKAFLKLIDRLLLEKDYQKISEIKLIQIKALISHYQIKNSEKEGLKELNVSFDRERMHNFFYENNIFYSDIISTEVIFFPLLITDKQYFVYSKNFFYENWNNKNSSDLIQYTLPVESIENLQIIEKYKENMIDIDINEFFKEYNINNKVFATIEIDEKNAKIFLNTKIRGSKIKKTIKVEKNNLNEIELNDKIILRIKDLIKDLIKSQNLIDVRTPSFLNVKINLANKNTLVEFDNRVKKIDLIDEFYVQQLNKDYVLVKIRYLGKISKIMNKLKDVDIELKMIAGQWQLNILK